MRARLAASGLAAALALAALPALAAAQRPTEEDLFGAPAPVAPAPPAAPAGAGAPRPEEAELFGAPGSPGGRDGEAGVPPRLEVRDDTLRIGGQLYLRGQTAALEDREPGQWSLSSPNLLDVYLDARPNDRVRAFVLGRLSYDPTLAPPAAGGAAGGVPGAGALLGAGAGGARGSGANPDAVLDQLWVNFDVGRRAFLTVGRQHAKWGVGRFWNPTDYLHPVRRDPLAVFDARTGTTLVKLHVPWEARGWNLYAVAVLEDVAGDVPRRNDGSPDGTGRLGRIGAGARAELVLGTVELGLDALAQDRHRPRFGVDVSAGVWDLDVYAEAALRTTVDTPRWRERPGATAADPVAARFERDDRTGFTPQVVAGATYAVKYSDEDAVTFGAEYFYDRSGYESPRIYPWLLTLAAAGATPEFQVPVAVIPGAPPQTFTLANPVLGEPNPFTPFYLGRHYAGAFASLPAPGRWNDTTFTLSVLGNLSDKSFVARLDHAVLVLTYLRLETWAAGRFGTPEGEFRLGLDVPPVNVGTATGPGGAGSAPVFTPPMRSPPQVFEAGVALRVSL